MNRFQKRCLYASAGTHGLLLTILVVGSAFRPEKLPDSLPILKVIPSTSVEEALAGGGNPDVAPPPETAPIQTETPPAPAPTLVEPTPPPPTPEPIKAPPPDPTPEPVKPEPKPKKFVEKKPEPEPEPDPEPPVAKPAKPEKINPTLPPKKKPTKPVKTEEKPDQTEDKAASPKKPEKKTEKKTESKPDKKADILDASSLTPVHSDKKAAEARAKAEADARQAKLMAAAKARADAIGRVGSNLSQSFAPGLKVEVPGPGGEAFANLGQIVQSKYHQAWTPPHELNEDSASVEVKVVIFRDGSVKSAVITRKSGHAALDKSVDRALTLRSIGVAFPEGAKDTERTFLINFNIKAKRGSG